VVDDIAAAGHDAHGEMLALLRGYVTTQIAGALAELGVAEALTAEPASAEALADALGLPPATLHRLLRAAATAGLVDEPAPGRFRATARSELLRPGVVGSLHHFARNVTGEAHWSVWGRLADAVRTGGAQAQPALGMSMWDHYRAHPDEEREFAAAMSERTATQTAAIVATAGLVDARRIVDVGGSQGALLGAFLAARPSATGVLFDRVDVVAGLAPDLGDPGLAGRVEIVGGDFFVEVPPGGDAYLLKLVLHDWPDPDAVRILRAVRAAIDPAGVLAVVELVVPPDGARSPAHLLDLSMLVGFGGRERTREEFRALLAESGFRLDEVLPLADDVDRAVLVATPV
jgi:hypothetical protein